MTPGIRCWAILCELEVHHRILSGNLDCWETFSEGEYALNLAFQILRHQHLYQNETGCPNLCLHYDCWYEVCQFMVRGKAQWKEYSI